VSSFPPLAFLVPNPRTTVKSADDGFPIQLHSATTPNVTSDQGWVTIETVVIRLDTNFTASGRFPVYWNNQSVPEGEELTVGYDAAVCVQKYEPWIIEAYNTSTRSSFALGIVEKQNGSASLPPSGIIQGAQIAGTRYLNATGKDLVFSTVHNTSATRFWEAGALWGGIPGGYYTPTPTVGPTVARVQHP